MTLYDIIYVLYTRGGGGGGGGTCTNIYMSHTYSNIAYMSSSYKYISNTCVYVYIYEYITHPSSPPHHPLACTPHPYPSNWISLLPHSISAFLGRVMECGNWNTREKIILSYSKRKAYEDTHTWSASRSWLSHQRAAPCAKTAPYVTNKVTYPITASLSSANLLCDTCARALSLSLRLFLLSPIYAFSSFSPHLSLCVALQLLSVARALSLPPDAP